MIEFNPVISTLDHPAKIFLMVYMTIGAIMMLCIVVRVLWCTRDAFRPTKGEYYEW